MRASNGDGRMRGRLRHFDSGDCMLKPLLKLEARLHATRDAFHRATQSISKHLALVVAAFAVAAFWPGAALAQTFESPTLALKTDWQIQSSARIYMGGGNAISQPGFPAPDWYPATVPNHSCRRASRRQDLPGPLLQPESPFVPGNEIQDRREFLVGGYAEG